jgi:hypothetical protein
VAYFQPEKSDRQFTSFTMHFTTNSPQKHHSDAPIFLKNPSKNRYPPQNKKTGQNPARLPHIGGSHIPVN